jgi:CRISPR-associated protein Csx3
MAIELTVEQRQTIQVLHVSLPDGVEPKELQDVKLPEELSFSQGVVIDGRAPIWVHSFLAHLCHPAVFVAHNDPRLGWVVTQNHRKSGPKEGTVLDNTLD